METGTAEMKINIEYIVGLMEGWLKDAGLNVSKHSHGGSIVVLGRDHDNDKIRLAYKIRSDGLIKGPNPVRYKDGSKAYEAVVLDIRNLLASEGLDKYDPAKRIYHS